MTAEQQIAEKTRQQLGGNRFSTMTGAKHFGYSEGGKRLSFQIGRNAGKVSHVAVILGDDDLYTMEFVNWRKMECKLIAKHEGVYAGSLQNTFTNVTGLATHL